MCDLFRICPIYFINLQSKCPHSLMDRIKDSGSFGRGSNPLGGTKPKRSDSASQSAFFNTCHLHHLSSQSKYSLCQNSAF